jgi:hypothetical protein
MPRLLIRWLIGAHASSEQGFRLRDANIRESYAPTHAASGGSR